MVSAQSGSGGNTLVDKIASKFNLNKSDVQKVFDEERSAHEAEHKARVEERLQTMVDEGSITSDQKTAILQKLDELKAAHDENRDSMKDLTKEQRKAKMDERKAELESWAKQQGLDLSKLKGVFMGPGHRGHGGPPPDAGKQ